MNRRPLGIGIINFAYWMAKNSSTYQEPDLEMVDTWAEAWSYYLIKASADLAVEKGACPLSNETKYGHGLTPNQTYKKDVDELVKHQERADWKGLRKQLKETGGGILVLPCGYGKTCIGLYLISQMKKLK